MAKCVSREYMEEAGRTVLRAEYLFVVENRFRVEDEIFHGLEHYFLVELDSYVIQSQESHLTTHWLPLSSLTEFDLRPHVVRDLVARGMWRDVKCLESPFA